jgi:hypothetical protein
MGVSRPTAEPPQPGLSEDEYSELSGRVLELEAALSEIGQQIKALVAAAGQVGGDPWLVGSEPVEVGR